MHSKPLWLKTLVGFFLSFLVSVSVTINIGFAELIPTEIFLLLATVGGFTVWVASVSWFLCVQRIRKPTLICLVIFSLSAAMNAWFFLGATS